MEDDPVLTQLFLLKMNVQMQLVESLPGKSSSLLLFKVHWHCRIQSVLRDFYFVSMSYILFTSCYLHFLMLHCSLSPVKQMAYIYPRLYNCSVPAPFLSDLPQLAQLCGGTKPPLSSDRGVEQIFSMQGEKLISFAKSEKFVDGKTSNKNYFIYLFLNYRHGRLVR